MSHFFIGDSLVSQIRHECHMDLIPISSSTSHSWSVCHAVCRIKGCIDCIRIKGLLPRKFIPTCVCQSKSKSTINHSSLVTKFPTFVFGISLTYQWEWNYFVWLSTKVKECEVEGLVFASLRWHCHWTRLDHFHMDIVPDKTHPLLLAKHPSSSFLTSLCYWKTSSFLFPWQFLRIRIRLSGWWYPKTHRLTVL